MRNLTKEIRIAITDGSIDDVIKLLDQGAPLYIGHFVIATELKLYEVLELFLSRGWDINTDVDRLRSSALVYACYDIPLLTWFLKHGANPNKRCDIRDCTPLSYAVVGAPFEAIKILFSYGGSVNYGQLLHYAAKRESVDRLEGLKYIYDKNPEMSAMKINKLLDQDCPDDFLMNYRAGLGTPLHFAALTGSLDCVKFLVEKGGDPWIRDPYDHTALSLAAYANHRLVIRFLEDLRSPVVSEQQEGGVFRNTDISV